MISKQQDFSLSYTLTHSQTYTQTHAHSQMHPADNPPLLIPPHHGCLSPQGSSHLVCIYHRILMPLCCLLRCRCVSVQVCVPVQNVVAWIETGISWLNTILTFRVLTCNLILMVNKIELMPPMVKWYLESSMTEWVYEHKHGGSGEKTCQFWNSIYAALSHCLGILYTCTRNGALSNSEIAHFVCH